MGHQIRSSVNKACLLGFIVLALANYKNITSVRRNTIIPTPNLREVKLKKILFVTLFFLMLFFSAAARTEASEDILKLRAAAENGDAQAQYKLGLAYRTGQGVKPNDAEAVKWYRKSADQGNAEGQLELGSCYNSGYGEKQNYTVALKWFRLAANQGNPKAQYLVGAYYERGLGGVPMIPDEAVKWYRLAADQGNAYAQDALKRLEVNTVVGTKTPKEINTLRGAGKKVNAKALKATESGGNNAKHAESDKLKRALEKKIRKKEIEKEERETRRLERQAKANNGDRSNNAQLLREAQIANEQLREELNRQAQAQAMAALAQIEGQIQGIEQEESYRVSAALGAPTRSGSFSESASNANLVFAEYASRKRVLQQQKQQILQQLWQLQQQQQRPKE